MAFDNTKYHCEINSVPYIISNYHKSELKPFIPRFTSGEQADSDFDLLKSTTIKGFSGGGLQRAFEDESSIYASIGMFPVYDDGVLYPVNALTEAKELLTTTKAKITAVMTMSNVIYFAYKTYGGSNAMKRLDSDGTLTSITLPSNISNSAREINSIVRSDTTVIYISVDDGKSLAYMANGSSTSATEIGTGTTVEAVTNLIMFRGQLYGLDSKQGSESNSILYRHTGGTSSRARVAVGKTVGRFHDYNAKILLYNNRIMLMRNNGMWAYDGVQVVSIEDTGGMVNQNNYRHPFVLKGYLYYFMQDGMYRFNGSLIEKLYDVSELGYPTAVCVGANRAWLAFSNSSAVESSRYDKAVGYDYSAGNTVNGRVMCFDGKGLFEYARTADWTQASPDFTGQGEISDIVWQFNKLHIFSNYDKIGTGGSGTNRYYTITTNEIANSGNKACKIFTSVFDGGYPMIDKSLENLELVLDGTVPSDQTITASYRTTGFDGSGSWTLIGSFFTSTHLKEYVFRNIPAGITYKQIQFKFESTALDVRTGIKKIVFRYTLSPDVKWQWQFTVRAHGDNPAEVLQLADGSAGSQAVSLLRNSIYTARTSDVPVKFLDIDQLDLNGAHNDSVTTITLNSTSLLKGSDGFIQIDDEIIYWYAKTSTQLTVLRAQLGTAAASHSDNAKVFIVYRTILEIVNERIELMDPGITDVPEDKSRSSDLTVILKEV